MNKAEKKFRLYAVLAVFVLLTLLLGIINCVNFTMASTDADQVTGMLAQQHGAFASAAQPGGAMPPEQSGSQPPGRLGPMGPDSPEMNDSMRYFTFAFDAEGRARTVAYHISAVTESEAEAWARSLLGASTGWTRGTYRYRVYEEGGLVYVTVIDQGRELLPCYRILVISACGELLFLLLSFLVLRFVGRRLFAPLEDADRKQKKFIANADQEFRLPLTVISADTELLEREHGPDDRTRSIRRQVKKLSDLVEALGDLAIFDEADMSRARVPLSDLLRSALDRSAERFAARGLDLEADIAPDISLQADPEAMGRMVSELIDNALKYSLTRARFSLRREKDRIVLCAENDTQLPAGAADQVFDRFTTLANAVPGQGAGLGLAYVKDIVLAHDGRISAAVRDGRFILKIAL